MKFTITGADRKTGRDSSLTLVAASAEEAEQLASKQGILVATVRPLGMATDISTDPLPMWDEDPAHPAPAITRNPPSQGNPQQLVSPPQPAPALPTTMLGANAEQDAIQAAAAAAQAGTSTATGQYHVIQNPALYLLETAVTKHMKEGWEPLGGIQVSNWNNQIQFYQALVRRKA